MLVLMQGEHQRGQRLQLMIVAAVAWSIDFPLTPTTLPTWSRASDFCSGKFAGTEPASLVPAATLPKHGPGVVPARNRVSCVILRSRAAGVQTAGSGQRV